VLLAVIGFATYHLVSTRSPHPSAAQTATLHPVTKPKPTVTPTIAPTVTNPGPPVAVIKLTATQDCWVGLTNAAGTQLYQGIVPAGHTMTWRERHPVSMTVGNPPGVVLTVNGVAQQMNPNQVATLAINPSQQNPVTGG